MFAVAAASPCVNLELKLDGLGTMVAFAYA
jgi:hypothetical protein